MVSKSMSTNTTKPALRQINDRITELEIRLTHQNDLVEQLNDVIYDQQKQMDLLVKRITALEKQVSDPAPANEKPPHY